MPDCPYCGSPLILKDSEIIYGRSYGNVWICSLYPACDAYVGCHKGTNTPLGLPANAALRKARNRAHAAFDPLWQTKKMTRHNAYGWLAAKMGLPREKCHIAMFDESQCESVVLVCAAKEFEKD